MISIHVTAKVTTRRVSIESKIYNNFNPRHREGDDLMIMITGKDGKISIHVTAKVTTVVLWKCKQFIENFNPRHREGDDGLASTGLYEMLRFQSTSPRR